MVFKFPVGIYCLKNSCEPEKKDGNIISGLTNVLNSD